MLRTPANHKDLVIDILCKSFNENKSINYIVKQDGHREKRIQALMEYSYEICLMFGEVLISDDKCACALLLYPDKKKTTLKSIILDIRLILKCVGFKNLKKAINRESLIKSHHPKGTLIYLWFIGVKVSEQNKGYGSRLLQDIILKNEHQNRTICLETSTVKNIPWYEQFGFEIYAKEIYAKEDFSYPLYFLKKEPKKIN